MNSKTLKHAIASAIRRTRRVFKSPDTPKVLCLFLYANTEKYKDSHASLDQFAKDFGEDICFLKIDNWHIKKKLKKLSTNTYEIGGNNNEWEFSGWQKGIDAIPLIDFRPDIILFLNDAYLNYADKGRPFSYFLSWFNASNAKGFKKGIGGLIDKSDQDCLMDGKDCSWWLKTSFFTIPLVNLLEISFVSLDSKRAVDFFPENWSGELFTPTAPINEELRTFLTWWITEGWDQAAPINAKNWPFIRSKLIAIVNERLLSCQFREQAIPILTRGRINRLTGSARVHRLK